LRGGILTDHEFNDINEALMFIEDGLIYRLPAIGNNPQGFKAVRPQILRAADGLIALVRWNAKRFN